MAYTAWSVVFGEQPTAAKWNQLGENDAGFKTGVNIDDASILVRHMGSDTFLWEKLAHVTLGADGDTIDTGTITARKYLRIIMRLYHNGANISSNLQFNADGGANYAFVRDSGNSLSQTSIGTGNSTLNQISWVDVVNISAYAKQLWMVTNFDSASAAAAPTRDTTVGKWHNTSAQITRVVALNGGAGSYATGSTLLVLGHD